MRQLLFKNLTSPDTHRRILCMSERIEQNGVRISTQRRCTYVLKKRIYIGKGSDLDRLKNVAKGGTAQQKHFHVIKRCDSRTGQSKVLCRATGIVYVVFGNSIYLVSFTNSLKICMDKYPG